MPLKYVATFRMFLFAFIIVVLILADESSIKLESLHLMLDTGNAMLSLLLAIFLLAEYSNSRGHLRQYLAVGFCLTAFTEILHALVGIEWSGQLEWIQAHSQIIRPVTWPPSTYVLPISMAWLLYLKNRKILLRPALFMAVMFVVTVVLFKLAWLLPRYSDIGILGIRRPTQIPLLVLWASVISLCFSARATHPIYEGLAWMGVMLFLSDLVMLYSTSPHEKFAMMAHFGKFFAYVLLHVIQLKIASANSKARNLAETELSKVNDQLSQLNETLEHRVEQRTDELLKINDAFRQLNESLEERIEDRTAKLQEMNDEFRVLNETLAESIEKEVKNSREKDGMLLQQSRLAAMGEMVGNIAHQWRQPINALNLVLINIEDAYRHNALTGDYLQQQIEKGERLVKTMSSTIDDFRNFFKSDGSQETFDIEQSIKEVLNIIEASFKNNGISVEIVVPQPVNTRGFPGQYRQVLLNIFSNAKDALLERRIANAKIVITLAQENEFAVVRVRDNAGGIKADVIEKVFDPYFTTRPQGNGIGLYMSKMIIENNMRGKLTVENTRDGAEFCIQTEISRDALPHQAQRMRNTTL